MDVTRSEFEDLVGAYALDACDAEEARAIDAYIAQHADAAAEAERLRGAAAWLGAAGALHPPVSLRDRLLAVAAERVEPVAPVEALLRETARFEALLDTVTDPDLDTVTFNGLSVRDLVAHVAIVDEDFVAAAHADSAVFIGAERVLAVTEAHLPETAGQPFREIRERLRRARASLVALDGDLPATARVGGYSLSSVLVIRAFETWTHCGDIAASLGRDIAPAEGPVLRTMAELAVQTLPLALGAKGYAFPGRTARVVVSGAGGGDWTIACGGEPAGASPDVILRVPIFEFCQRFAERVGVDDVPFEIEGDVELGRALLDAAPAFAGL